MKIIGVDLGTTNSCIYYLDEGGNPVLAMDQKKNKIFPSAVWCEGPGKEVVVGHKAKARMGRQPPPIIAVKRLMGTTQTVHLGGMQVSPVQVSTHILNYAKSLVETDHDRIEGAVVTIPAYFDSAPKQDTYKAAVDAFFGGDEAFAKGRLELVLEPEAAAYAYLVEDPRKELTVLVYDLGGGTFDVTILQKSQHAGLMMLKFGGDPHLGGENIDNRIGNWMLYLLRGGKPEALDRILLSGRYDEERRYKILQQVLTNDVEQLRGELHSDDRDLLIGKNLRFLLDLDPNSPEDLLRIQTLKWLAEQAKKDLTATTEAVIARQGAFEDQEGTMIDIDLTLSRSEFELLIGDYVASTLQETLRVVREAGMMPDRIDQVLLVGGSTRMPVIRQELEKRFQCPVQMKDPDLIVARGGALRARDLNPPPRSGRGNERMTLEYPRQTRERQVTILGRLRERLLDYDVFLFQNNKEVASAPVDGDRFMIKDVSLEPNATNTFLLEVADQEDRRFAEAEITIRQDDNAILLDKITTPLTKPIRYLGTQGFVTLFAEGEKLPAKKAHVCYRATLDDFIKIPFYEGERALGDLHMPGVAPSLPLEAAIDLEIEISKEYTGWATATVRATKQSQKVEFKISRIEIPSLEAMDRDLEGVIDQFDNDIDVVRDPNARAKFSRRVRNLENDFRKARRELTPDPHKLYTIIGELKKVLIEIAGAQTFLNPPFETFEMLVAQARRLAEQLDAGSPLPKKEVLQKIAVLERAGKSAWEKEDAPIWRTTTEEIEKLCGDLQRASSPSPGPDITKVPPEAIQIELLEWVEGLRKKISERGLEGTFGSLLDQIAGALRRVNLRDAQEARSALLEIAGEQIGPLEHKIQRAIKANEEKGSMGGTTTVE
jgi:molecular chaperone DnaK (HSP70)